MNIEIANRLVTLRKRNSLSQEALAEKLGISRQAVSKWERAEASPDTDNLILLSRIYGISMDELLSTEDEIPVSYMDMEEEKLPEKEIREEEGEILSPEKEPDEYVHIGLSGIHCKDKDSEVHVGWKGIHVIEKDKDEVHLDSNGIYVNGKRYDSHFFREWAGVEFPFTLLVIAAFIAIGVLTGAWHPAWVIFYHTLISFLCGGLPEKRYGMVCLSRSYYDDIPASWHIQKSLASGLAAVFNGSRILRHCRLHQDAERKTAAG